MNEERIKSLLDAVASGRTTVEKALKGLKGLPYEELGFATVDTHRALRVGFPEVIYGEGKTAAQMSGIIAGMVKRKENVLVTRLESLKAAKLKKKFPRAMYNATSRTLHIKSHPVKKSGRGTLLVICAGTSDIPVAEEAAVTAECLGNKVERLYDVGVAGLHRLLAKSKQITEANVLIVVAGMEGALPSVVAGLVSRPVIAVPTSVGYGANLGGITTMLAMLNSCASGVSVVNIDNGFGAAYSASLINRD